MSKINAKRYALLPGRWRQIADGTLDPAEFDDEEIFSGRLRDSSGKLGPKPVLLPQAFIEEQQKRMIHWASDKVRESMKEVLNTIVEIATDPNQSAADRLKAAFWLAERFMGKVPEKLVLSAEDPVESLFKSILQDPNGLAPHEPTAIERAEAARGE